MKNIAKKLFIIAAIIIMMCIISVVASAETYGDLTYSVSNGKITITDCIETATEVEIPAEIDGYPVTGIGMQAFMYCSSLASVRIPDSVTNISVSAFLHCTSLTSIIIPDSVTNIDYQAFQGCTNLVNIIIPEGVTYIGGHAFMQCSSLASIIIPKSVKHIDAQAFEYCTSLTHIIIPNSITSISSRVFANCSKLRSITIPDSVTTIDNYAFSGCSSLKGAFYTGTQEQWNNITIGSNNSALTSAVYYNVDEDYLLTDNVLFNKNGTMLIVFVDCDRYYVVPDTVKSIEQNAFSYVNTLHTVILPQGLKNIGSYAFYYTNNLTSIYIPASVSTIDTYAFYGTKLTDVYFGGTQEQWNAIAIGNNNSNLKNANIHYNAETIVEDGVIYNLDKTVLICYDKTDKSFTVPATVKTIDTRAFKDCKNLQQIILPAGLEEIKSEAFYNCTSLSEIVIPDSVTTIEASAFYGCTALQSVEFGDGLTTIGNSAFYGCTAIEKFTLPENLVSISDSAFYGCTNLNEIYFPDSLESIGSSAFKNCSALTYISLPDGLISLGSAVFRNCSSLKKICLSESGLASISANAFNGCSKLSDIYIPVNITSFGDSAFLGCNLLTDIYFGGTENEWNNISIVSSNSVIWAANIHYEHEHTFGEWTVLIPSQNNSDRVEKTLCLVCGYEKRVSIDGNHVHNYTKIAETPTSCTTAGHASYVCDCELDYTKVLAATGHTFTNTTVNKQHLVSIATCCSKAEYYYKCEDCDIFSDIDTFEYGEIDSSNHTGGTEVRNAVTEDCGNNGYTGDTYCLGCNTKIADGSVINATGNHNHTSKITTAATCNATGIRTYTCSVCRDTYTETVAIDSANHTGGTEIRGAVTEDCGNNGYTGDTYCLGCNTKITDGTVIPTTSNHNYTSEITTAATCCTSGIRTYTCIVCDDTYTETVAIDATNHIGGTEIRDIVAEDCGNDGYTGDTYCLGCNAKIADGYVVPATSNHNYSSEITTAATCNTIGVKTYICSVCDDTYTETVKIDSANHVGGTEIRDAVVEDCGNNGYTGDTYCLSCNAKIANGSVIPATVRHKHTSSVTTPATCKTTGVRTYICTVCEDTYTEIIGIDTTNHTGGTGIRGAITEDCSNNGYTGDTYCLGCNAKIANGTAIPATGNHAYASEVTTPATCITTGVRTYTCTVCDDTYTETVEIDSANHTGGTEVRNAVTEDCGNNGYIGDTYCLDCNAKITNGSVIPATGNHNHSSSITLPATCKTTGVRTYICTVCEDTYTETIAIDTTNHSGGTENRGAITEDCGNNGYIGDTYCLGCNEKIANGSVIPATGKHNHSSSITLPATCKTTGVRTYTCTVCEDTYTETIGIDTTNHTGGTEIRGAITEDCSNNGYTGDTYCLGCNAKIANGSAILATGNHSYTSEVTTPATCITTGVRTYTCNVCKDTYTETINIDSTNHTVGTEVRNAVAEDCGNNGYTGDTYCLGCNAKIANGSAIPATGNHSYTSEVTTPATCITTSLRTYICSVCEDTYTEIIAIDSTNHTGGTEIRGAITEDCSNNGYTGDTYCLGCNAKIANGTVVPATGKHNHSSSVTLPATCKTTGVRTYTCTVCEDTYTETIGIDTTNHTGGTEIRGAITEDCSNNGYTGDTYCLGCNAKIANGTVVPATGKHNHSSSVTLPATCKTTGVRTYTCNVCKDTYTETINIDSTNHTGGTEVRNEIDATCTSDGYSGDVYCTGCNEIVFAGKTINVLGHTEIVLTGKSATCTETGLTEGKKCSACGEILVAQKELSTTGHTTGEWEVVVPARVGIEGKEQQKCTVCGTVVNEREIPALEPQYILGDANGDGKITAADARIALRISAKLDKIEDFNLPLAALDVTGDEKLTAADARKILRISAKLE